MLGQGIDTLLPTTTAAVTAIVDNVGIFQGTVASGATTDDSSLSISGTISAGLAAGETVRIYDGGTYLGNASVSDNTWSYADSRTLINAQSVSYTALVADAAGNQSTAGSAYTATLDTVAPTGSLNPTAPVETTTADGSYGIGKVINLAVQFSEAVFVDATAGTPRLQLETGAVDRYAVYTGGSGTNTLSFSYTVQAGDSSADLDQVFSSALELNGGTIRDAAGNNANFSLAAPGAVGSLAANAAIVIATAPPNSHLFSTVTKLEWDQGLDSFITGTTYAGANFMLAEVSGIGRPFQGDEDGNLNAKTWEKVSFGDLAGDYLPIFTDSSYYYYYGAVNTGNLGGWGLFLSNQSDEFYLLDVDGNCNLSPGINVGSWDSWLPNTYYFATNVVCFLGGTLIATPDGERPIESLKPGDTSGNDTIQGLGGNDILNADAGDGADTVQGGAGDDSILGNTGNDSLAGGSENDTISGDAGNDTISGAGLIEGGDDNDNLYYWAPVSTGAATVFGGAGNDLIQEWSNAIDGALLDGCAGNDTIDGGSGVDVATYSGNRSNYLVSQSAGVFTVQDTRNGAPDGTDILTNVEILSFADDDQIIGDITGSLIEGGSGNDSLSGGAAADTI